jgi:hypothetical protein
MNPTRDHKNVTLKEVTAEGHGASATKDKGYQFSA